MSDLVELHPLLARLNSGFATETEQRQAATALEAKEAEIEALRERVCDQAAGIEVLVNQLAAMKARAETAERALTSEQNNVYRSFDKWSAKLGWGLSGHQPECWALMDSAVDEFVTTRRERDEARAALKPFATYLDQAKFDLDNKGRPLPDDQGMGWVYLTIGDFRRAARAVIEKE